MPMDICQWLEEILYHISNIHRRSCWWHSHQLNYRHQNCISSKWTNMTKIVAVVIAAPAFLLVCQLSIFLPHQKHHQSQKQNLWVSMPQAMVVDKFVAITITVAQANMSNHQHQAWLGASKKMSLVRQTKTRQTRTLLNIYFTKFFYLRSKER